MNIQDFELKCAEAAQFLGLLASEPRLRILCKLIEGELPVGEIARLTGMRQATTSQHLALLRDQGIVRTKRDGTTIYYSIADRNTREVMKTLARIYCSDTPGR